MQTIASESICIQCVPCSTAASVGAMGVHAVMGTVVNLQRTLINIYGIKPMYTCITPSHI